MLSLVAPIFSLLSGVVLLLLGNGLLNTLLTLRGLAEGYTTGQIGLMMSGYFAGYLFGSRMANRVVRRVGHIRAFSFAAAVAAIVALLHVILIDPWIWLGLRVLYGMALVTLYMVIESWLNAQTTRDNRGQVFAIYMAANLGALAVAQQLLNLASPMLFTLFALAAILITSALTPITLTRMSQPLVTDQPSRSLLSLTRQTPLPVVAAILSGLALGAFWGMAPVYAQQSGFDAAGTATLMTITIIGGALLQWPIGRWSDRHDRGRVLVVVVFLASLASLGMCVFPAGIELLGLFFLWGGLAFSIYSIAVAQMCDQLQPDEILAASGGLLLANGLGSAIGPVAAAGVMGLLGAIGLPVYLGVVLLLLALLGMALNRRRAQASTEEPAPEAHAHFTPMLRTSPAVMEMMAEAISEQAEDAELQAAEDAAQDTANAPQDPLDAHEPSAIEIEEEQRAESTADVIEHFDGLTAPDIEYTPVEPHAKEGERAGESADRPRTKDS